MLLRFSRVAGAALSMALAVAAACRHEPLPEVARAERDTAAGRRIFDRRCVSCHNANGDGQTRVASRFPYANLRAGRWKSDGTLASIERQVRLGDDPMPSFAGKLTDEEIRQVATYVLALARAAGKGGGAEGAGGR
ncbi:MAG TPA: c-type cytochrome [Thermoanaerobaculia bacterium]|nr:c-type cytochrome [Thermoanaerobaculia bacterium]